MCHLNLNAEPLVNADCVFSYIPCGQLIIDGTHRFVKLSHYFLTHCYLLDVKIFIHIEN